MCDEMSLQAREATQGAWSCFQISARFAKFGDFTPALCSVVQLRDTEGAT